MDNYYSANSIVVCEPFVVKEESSKFKTTASNTSLVGTKVVCNSATCNVGDVVYFRPNILGNIATKEIFDFCGQKVILLSEKDIVVKIVK